MNDFSCAPDGRDDVRGRIRKVFLFPWRFDKAGAPRARMEGGGINKWPALRNLGWWVVYEINPLP